MVVLAALICWLISDSGTALAFPICLVLFPLVSGLLQQLALRGAHLEYRLTGSRSTGDQAELEITLTRESRLPMGTVQVRIEAENILFQETKVWLLALQPAEKKVMVFREPILMENCGSVLFRVTECRSYDLLGLFCKRIVRNNAWETLVWPGSVDLTARLMRKPETQNFGEFYDPYKKGQDVSEVAGLRDYMPGDSLGSIHWKLSGKLDGLVVREFGYPSNYTTVILYDLMKKADGTEISDPVNNMVLSLTDALSRSLLELGLGHNVGCVDDGTFRSAAVESVSDEEQMLRAILSSPIPEEKGRGDSIYYFLRSRKGNEFTKVVYITPEYEEQAARQLAGELDLTILHVTEGTAGDNAYAPGYSVIPVDVTEYQSKPHYIAI